MFYGQIPKEENQRLIDPIRPSIRDDFEIVRNNLTNGFVFGKCAFQRATETF